MHVLGDLTPANFLADYWQKRPLLVRRAWPGFADPFTPEELAGLACEDNVEARLIREYPQRALHERWQIQHSPLVEKDFLELQETHWTLLIQDADKQAPLLAELLEPFRFIPDWRIDDLMVSYAALQGSVGPHIDNYDVFLLQGQGRRRWQIMDQPIHEEDCLADSELRLLTRFAATQEWILEPGDLLYLPPRIAHWGVALEPCITYSIGCRAPSHHELLSSFFEFLLEHIDSDARYRDPDLTTQHHPGEITPATLNRIIAIVRSASNPSDEVIASWFGRFITEPKPAFSAEAEPEPWEAAELLEHLKNGGSLERNAGSRFAFITNTAQTTLFIDGQEFVLGSKIAHLAPLLCQHRVLDYPLLRKALVQESASEMLLDLVNEGYLVVYEEDEEDMSDDENQLDQPDND